MIGWVQDLVVEHVLAPQAAVADVTRRAYLDPDARPINVTTPELDVIGLSTVPVDGAYEIGGGMTLRHTITAALEVEGGDPAQNRVLRDAIVLDLALRLVDSGMAFREGSDPASGQYVTRVRFAIDYRPLAPDTPSEFATLTITVDCQLDR